jgi:hypothetical protein
VVGYEDLNDHDHLRLDPIHGLIAGKSVTLQSVGRCPDAVSTNPPRPGDGVRMLLRDRPTPPESSVGLSQGGYRMHSRLGPAGWNLYSAGEPMLSNILRGTVLKSGRNDKGGRNFSVESG